MSHPSCDAPSWMLSKLSLLSVVQKFGIYVEVAPLSL